MFDREFHIRFTLSQLVRVLLLSPLVLLPAWLLISLPWGSESAPGWAQAVGSITAVGVAIWISNQQAQLAGRERRERECVYMHKAFKTASVTSAAIRTAYIEILGDMKNYRAASIYLDQIRHSMEDMGRFSYAELVDMQFADLFEVVQRMTRIVISEIEELLQGRSSNFVDGLPAIIKGVEEAIGPMRSALETHCARQGVSIDIESAY